MAVILFFAGMAAFLLPIVTTELAISQDAADYEALTALAKNVGTVNPAPSNKSDLVGVYAAQAPVVFPAGTSDTATEQRHTSVDMAACKAANGDFIGWLQIPDTTVDYPVVQTDDVDYYLHHTFAGKKSYIGTLFSLGKTDFQTPSRNIAIYGHHIRSNAQVMFSPLTEYKDQDFYADHKTIYFDTLYHAGAYKVFAAINIHNGDWEPSKVAFADDNAFLDFVHHATSQALYDTGIQVQASDQILTLITCDRTYGGKDGRLVVMAVRQ